MGEVACFASQALESRLVQNLAKKAGEVPEEFVYKNGLSGAIDAPEMWKEKLLIDVSLLSSSSPQAKDELAKFKTALSDWGCCLLVNHGMERPFIKDMIANVQQFFSLSFEDKMKSSSSTNEILHGYQTDAVCQGKLTRNWNDRIFLTISPKEKVDRRLWPQNPQTFGGMVDELTEKIEGLTEVLYKAMAKSVNVEEDFFIEHAKQGLTLGRFTLYPKCPRPESVLGSRAHLDGSLITVVVTEQPGLQVEKDNQWYKVPVIPGAILINCGDFIEVLSNGIFKSTLHRVVTNAEEERISVAAFCTLDGDHVVEPKPEFVTNERPPLYKKFIPSEYMMIMHENDVPGLNALDVMKL